MHTHAYHKITEPVQFTGQAWLWLILLCYVWIEDFCSLRQYEFNTLVYFPGSSVVLKSV